MKVIRFTEPLSSTTNTVYITEGAKGRVNMTDSYGSLELNVLRYHGKGTSYTMPEFWEVFLTEEEAKDAVIRYLNSIGRKYEIIDRLTVNVTVYGDAPDAFGFEAETEPERYIQRIRRDFDKKQTAIRKEANTLFPLKFSPRERGVTGDKAGHDAFIQAAMTEQGLSKGENFIQTPLGRIEWKYLITHMGDPNNADTDRSKYEFVLSEYGA